MTTRSIHSRLFWSAALSVIVLDALTKWLAVKHLTPHIPRSIVGQYVRFTLAFNPGAAFSMSLGSNSRYIFGAFAVIALFILWRLYRASLPGEMARVFALALAWGGAAGNLVDRLIPRGAVVDFIDIGVDNVRFWTFNVADSAVTVGAILLAIVLWHEDASVDAERDAEPTPIPDAAAATVTADSDLG